jgi:hypothetical protein
VIKTVGVVAIGGWISAGRPDYVDRSYLLRRGGVFSFVEAGGSSCVDRRVSVRDDDFGRACIIVI